MPALDDDIITGLAKLAGKEVPVRVLKAKFKLAELQEELDGVSQLPGERRRFFKWLLPERPAPAAHKADALRAEIEAAKADFLEGVLVPLTVADDMECDAHYGYASRNLQAHKPELRDQEAVDAWRDAVNFTVNHTMLCKRIECALKRKVKAKGEPDRYERLLKDNEARRLDTRLLWELWSIYRAAFILTESELGKSAAPSPAS
jgi:hypothetical protein